MEKTVKKAVIPVAGLGTRFLPASKAIPKEMLPLVDCPIILKIAEEVVESGIEDLILVTGRHKTSLEEFFDRNFELEDVLEKSGKTELLQMIRKISSMVNVISIRQKNPLGLGHAVYCAQPIVGNNPFAVLLGDEVMRGSPTVTSQLVSVFEREKKSVVAIMEVPPTDVKKYGIVKTEPLPGHKKTFRVTHLVEKPGVQEAPSRWALPGRYVFSPAIFDALRDTAPTKNGEIQLTDAMLKLAKQEGLLAHCFEGERHDAGDKLGYVCANIAFGLDHKEIGKELRQHILDLAKRLPKGLQ